MSPGLPTGSDSLATPAGEPAAWFYPAISAAAAVLVLLPILGFSIGTTMLYTLTAQAFWVIALVHHRRTGVKDKVGTTPKSLAIVLLALVILAGLVVTSLLLAWRDQQGWILVATAAAFVVMLGGLRLAERAYRIEAAARR